MRVAMYYSNHDVRIEEEPVPKIGPQELLLKIEASGICGSDVMEWYRRSKVPLVLGHEVSGIISQIGKEVKGYKEGERIAAAHHVPCGTCSYCLNGQETVCETLRKTNFDPGGFAEFVRLPQINVENGIFRLPDELSFEEATFIEPLACVVRGQRIAGFRPGQTVLVIGSGISGILHIQLARLRGAGKIVATDISEYRLNMANRLGADVAWDASRDIVLALRDLNNGRLADLVVLCTGAQSAIHQALHSVERGGTVLFFAATEKSSSISLAVNELFWRNEITLTSSYAGSYNDHLEALELIRQNKINVKDMITHRLPLADTEKGFRLVAEAKESIKVIIEPQK
jgi:L-iditol 2-dehydrogenase